MVSKLSKEMRQEIKMYQASGWEVYEETPAYVELRRNTATGGGHLLVFLLTFWTWGIGNLIYYFVKKQKKKLMK